MSRKEEIPPLYFCRYESDNVMVSVNEPYVCPYGNVLATGKHAYFCYSDFRRITGIRLKERQMVRLRMSFIPMDVSEEEKC